MNPFQRRAFLAASTAGLAAVAVRSAMAQPVPGSLPPGASPKPPPAPPAAAAPLVPPGGPAKPPAPSSEEIAAEATMTREPAHLPQPDARHGMTFEADKAAIFYQKFGQGPAILLVHGYPLSGAMFSRVVNILAHTHTVITPDLRGYGQSRTSGTADTLQTHADDMLALMDHLGIDKATVGGMSMGGMVALEMLRKAPARLEGLVLIDTTAAAAEPQEAGMWRGLASVIENHGIGITVPFLLPQMLSGATRTVDRAQVSYLTRIIKQCSTSAGVSGANALASRANVSDLLAKIEIPTLVLVGQEDSLTPFEVAQDMLSLIRNATLHIVLNAGHAAIFEKPEDAGGAIASWSQTTRSASAK